MSCVYVWFLVDERFISEPFKFPVFEIATRSKSIVDVICFIYYAFFDFHPQTKED